jgi:protein-S-isoprenylcysteine O-methyltransferase
MSATTLISIAGVITFLGYEVVLRRRDAQTATWSADADDRGSTRLILAAYTGVVALNVAASRTTAGAPPAGWRWLGVGLLLLGLVIRGWAMTVLGRFYTRTLRTVDEQQVIERGPYRIVRHPGYSGSLLVWVGYSLGLGNWIAAIFTLAVLGCVYVWRINAEETLLLASFGEHYANYQRHTKRLVPFLY